MVENNKGGSEKGGGVTGLMGGDWGGLRIGGL